MIKSKMLKAATGVQVGDVIDNTESTSLPSTSDGVIVGKFKRGRLDKPFVVTRSTYQGLLGRDLRNPSYNVIEDALKRGVSGVWVQRVGASDSNENGNGGNNGGGDGGAGVKLWQYTEDSPYNDSLIDPSWANNDYLIVAADIEIDGVASGFILGTVGVSDARLAKDSLEDRLTIIYRCFSHDTALEVSEMAAGYGQMITYPKDIFHVIYMMGENPSLGCGLRAIDMDTREHYAMSSAPSNTFEYTADRQNLIQFMNKPSRLKVCNTYTESKKLLDWYLSMAGAGITARYVGFNDLFNDGKEIIIDSDLTGVPSDEYKADMGSVYGSSYFDEYVSDPSLDILN